MNESKRKEFYLSTDVWKEGVSCHAKTVLAYLSFCSNKNGESFPSIKRIADECSVCRNTVKKAISELANAGLIEIEPRMIRSVCGSRQTSNRYRLLTRRGLPDGWVRKEPGQPVAATEAACPKPVLAAVVDTGTRETEDSEGERRLEALLDRLEIRRYYVDESMAKALELAIKELWYSESIRVKGETVTKKRVRERLEELDIDALDSVIDAISSYEKYDNTAYLKACLYNAPLKASTDTATQIAKYRYEHG